MQVRWDLPPQKSALHFSVTMTGDTPGVVCYAERKIQAGGRDPTGPSST